MADVLTESMVNMLLHFYLEKIHLKYLKGDHPHGRLQLPCRLQGRPCCQVGTGNNSTQTKPNQTKPNIEL